MNYPFFELETTEGFTWIKSSKKLHLSDNIDELVELSLAESDKCCADGECNFSCLCDDPIENTNPFVRFAYSPIESPTQEELIASGEAVLGTWDSEPEIYSVLPTPSTSSKLPDYMLYINNVKVGNITDITWSKRVELSPTKKGFKKGRVEIVGSFTMEVTNRHPLIYVIDESINCVTELPPFLLTVIGISPNGSAASMSLDNVEIIGEVAGINAHDLVNLINFNFIATNITPWRPF